MNKKKKGLADSQDGDFILNESGTSVNNPWDAAESLSDDKNSVEEAGEDKNNNKATKTTDADDQAS